MHDIFVILRPFYTKCAIIVPCKHVVMCQNWASTGPMLSASAQYRPSSSIFAGFVSAGNLALTPDFCESCFLGAPYCSCFIVHLPFHQIYGSLCRDGKYVAIGFRFLVAFHAISFDTYSKRVTRI